MYCPYFGGLFFAAKLMQQNAGDALSRSSPRDVIACVSIDGVHILSGWNLVVDETYKFEEITKWTVAHDPDLFAFAVHDETIYFLVCDYPRYVEDTDVCVFYNQ